MNFNEEQFKNALKKIRMSQDERTVLRTALYRHIENYNKPIESPFVEHAHRFILRPMQAVALMLVVLVSSGTGLSYAANEALPGDPLYGFKIGITEEIRTITMKDEDRAEYEVQRAAKRLEETAQLALTGRLDHNAESVIREQLTKHTDKAKKFAYKASVEKPETPANVAADIASELSAHSEVLTEIKEIKKINGELSAILETTDAKVAQAEKDEEEALATLATNTTNITKERVDEQQEKLQEKLTQLEAFVTLGSDTIETTLDEIATDLETLSIPSTTRKETADAISVSSKEFIEKTETTDVVSKVREEDVVAKEIAAVEVELENLGQELQDADNKENDDTVTVQQDAIQRTEGTTLENPTLIEDINASITTINELAQEAQLLEDDEAYGQAYTELQKALKQANNLLARIALKEKYSATLEAELITPEAVKATSAETTVAEPQENKVTEEIN